ncbi:hypothetical protein EV193_106280 [Herbihabitans rhizosphaerae]|uniref:Uncharacterized protein n=1 Tax=Herbihabitans rhizosphaerae TaxID=1872711 RepID=A0A4Q7KLD4_9PSEU|nr:hypothetical protein [Herbihabitans rhizosphaerae]RZS37044.1 hypothetical protein EV193_106280 [Herbihabitans rhizosphaerae]
MDGQGYQVAVSGVGAAGKALGVASEDLNNLAPSAPGMPDAGDLSGDLAQMISKLTGAAGEIVLGTGAAAEAVNVSGKSYFQTDDAVARTVSSVDGPK